MGRGGGGREEGEEGSREKVIILLILSHRYNFFTCLSAWMSDPKNNY